MISILIESVGWLSSFLIVVAYFLNIRSKISSSSSAYIYMNLIGGLGFIIHTYVHGAYPSMLVNVVWVIIGLSSIVKKS